MQTIVTGMSGAVGSALRAHLENAGHRAIGWDRNAAPVDDASAMETWLRAQKPDALFHLAIASRPTSLENEGRLVNVEWPGRLARLAAAMNIPFVFTSTVMVYTNDAVGPFTPETPPDAAEGYGREKLDAEKRVREAHPAARIARLGWQIGNAHGSNNMIDFFHKQWTEHGRIAASRRWLPACSFLEDTAETLTALLDAPPGTYLLNANERWSFYEIASALNEKRGRPWKIEPTDDFVYDQRMIDGRIAVASLQRRLPELR